MLKDVIHNNDTTVTNNFALSIKMHTDKADNYSKRRNNRNTFKNRFELLV